MCKSNSIDDDAELIGITPKTWKEFRMTQYKERELPNIRELPLERELPPPRMEQAEFESITNPIDDREAFIRHKQEMARRWFGYYRKCKDKQKKFKLIDQYNYLARRR